MTRRRRVLSVYNRYLTRGGEDQVFESEVSLLLQNGHEAVPFTVQTSVPRSITSRAKFAVDTLWSRQAQSRFEDVLRLVDPQVAHFYNTFPILSPSVYASCKRAGVAVVQTVQNYRLVCPRATLYRAGSACYSCVGRRIPWPAVFYRCYHDSRLETAVVASMLTIHRLLGTWKNMVDVYLAATEASRTQLVAGGLPSAKVLVKPNFLSPDPGERDPEDQLDTVLYVGRLSQEKGVPTLLRAWEDLAEIPLVIVGDGPLSEEVNRFAKENSNVRYLGRLNRHEVIRWMLGSRFLIFPSEWFEGFPMTIIEAFGCGLPVVASRLGAMSEAVTDGFTGRLFRPGDADDLRRVVREAWAPDATKRLGANARSTYLAEYTAEKNLRLLLEVYDQAEMNARVRN